MTHCFYGYGHAPFYLFGFRFGTLLAPQKAHKSKPWEASARSPEFYCWKLTFGAKSRKSSPDALGHRRSGYRILTVILIVGTPGCKYPGVVAGNFSLIFCAQARGFHRFLVFFIASSSLFVIISWVLRPGLFCSTLHYLVDTTFQNTT
jgi:hypothetical protein